VGLSYGTNGIPSGFSFAAPAPDNPAVGEYVVVEVLATAAASAVMYHRHLSSWADVAARDHKADAETDKNRDTRMARAP